MNNLTINLRTLFTTPYDLLPKFVDYELVIYKIENLINHKVYIGQARWFYGRFVANGEFSHLGSYKCKCINGIKSRKLYNALKKYGCKNFEVTILIEAESQENLNDLEIEYISKYDSYYNGYNMTRGGDNCDHLHTEEAYNKLRKIYNGILPFNSPESIKKSFESNLRNHGGKHSLSLWYIHEKSITSGLINKLKIRIEWAKNDGLSTKSYWNTFESSGDASRHIKSILDWIYELRNHPDWTSDMELIFSEFENLNGDYSDYYDSDEDRCFKSTLTFILNSIRNHLDNLDQNNLELTSYNYRYKTGDRHICRHIKNILPYLDDLRSDIRWTVIMEDIFKNFKLTEDNSINLIIN